MTESLIQPTTGGLLLGILLVAVSVGLLTVLSRSTEVAHSRWHWRVSQTRLLVLSGTVLMGLIGALGSEMAVRTFDPQEVNGWGERPALEPHDIFGWHLIPDRQTRLRWENYDYVVESNSIGFPGPLYPESRQPDTLRILTLGDAFTSAEGVDTDIAWPRQLEVELQHRLPHLMVEVLNFAVTGYGPNQYSEVFAEYGPRFRPDVVIVGFHVNDHIDVLATDDVRRASIGFGSQNPDSLESYLQLAHLKRWVKLKIVCPIRSMLNGGARSHGYFLGGIRPLEVGSEATKTAGFELVTARLGEMKSVADSIGAVLVLALVPAPVQVCEPEVLLYLPMGVDLGDTDLFDADLPQKLSVRAADAVGIEAVYDLRPTLSAADECPYQPHNRHLLANGHWIISNHLADVLLREGIMSPFVEPVS